MRNCVGEISELWEPLCTLHYDSNPAQLKQMAALKDGAEQEHANRLSALGKILSCEQQKVEKKRQNGKEKAEFNKTPFRQSVHVKAFIVLEKPYFLPLSSSANVFPHLILIFTVPIKRVFLSSLPPDSSPFAHICPRLLAQGAALEPLSMRELFLETGPYK
ncbi:uncharacterized [Tachysurus ichikawai]